MNEHKHARNLASYQYEQEFYKHLATLSTGSIVLIVTFLEKLFTKPEAKAFVGVSLVAFCLSIVGTLGMQLWAILEIETTHAFGSGRRFALFFVLVCCGFGGFLVGIGGLVIFAWTNLY